MQPCLLVLSTELTGVAAAKLSGGLTSGIAVHLVRQRADFACGIFFITVLILLADWNWALNLIYIAV